MKEKKIDEKPKKGRRIMWAFIYSGVFYCCIDNWRGKQVCPTVLDKRFYGGVERFCRHSL